MIYKNKSRLRMIYGFMIMIIVVVGCSVQGNNITEPSLTDISQATDSVSYRTEQNTKSVHPFTLTTTPLTTWVITPTPTITLRPTITSRPTVTPRWTPVATLPADEALAKITSLYSGNGGCQLPCWWGITPGVTPWRDARELLSPLGDLRQYKINEYMIAYTIEFPVPEEMDDLGLGFFSPSLWVKENRIVSAITLNAGWIMGGFDYSLTGILSSYGQPYEIWIYVNTDTMFLPHYDLELYYPHNGIKFNSSGDARAVNETFVTICPQKFQIGEFPPSMTLWNPSQLYKYETLDSELLGKSDLNEDVFLPLSDLTDEMSEDEFYTIYRNPHTTKCINLILEKIPY